MVDPKPMSDRELAEMHERFNAAIRYIRQRPGLPVSERLLLLEQVIHPGPELVARTRARRVEDQTVVL